MKAFLAASIAACVLFEAGIGFAKPGQSLEDSRKHWAYQPLTNPPLPKVQNRDRVGSAIDAFLLSKLEARKMTFARPAEKSALLRRVYYDLTGLPPTFEDLAAFAQDDSPGAFEKVVERLLASPRYGERWGRHWLDAARYADTKDLVLVYGKDALRPFAYTYRDYVVRAFNEDLPYNQFITDQLAADLGSPALPRWRLAGLGFLTLGRMFDNNPHDQIDDQIDTTTRAFLALTVACARCHDHKYDAITQKDYYGLYGVFASTERPYDLPLLEEPKEVPGGVEFESQLAKARQELEQHIDAEFAKLTENFRQRIGDYLVRAATTAPDLTETTQFGLSLIPEDFRPGLVQRTRRLLERRANPGDHVFGTWARLMALPEERLGGEAAKEIFAASNSCNPLVTEALTKASLTNRASVARVYGSLLLDVYQESKKPVAGSPSGGLNAAQKELLELVTGKESPIWFPRRDTPDHMSRAEKDRYGTLVANLDKLAVNATNAPAARAMVLADLPEPFEPYIFKRGNPSRPGEAVPRAFIGLLSQGAPKAFQDGSGRLELAEAIASPANPLTARVLVNRVWMHHFGAPLVGTTTDFGTRSQPPLHAELLDWLAYDFVKSGWSVKHLHRVMILSRAYQQACASTAEARVADPENAYLACYARQRLDLEAMRDSLLFASGNLTEKIGGRPIDFVAEPLSTRRTIYGLVDRQNVPGLYRAFDFAIPDQCAERRPKTTVPQQALFGLNSPFVLEQAKALAARAKCEGNGAAEEKVDVLFQKALGRHANSREVERALRFVEGAKNSEPGAPTAWEQFAQVLLVSNEAMFID